MNHGIQFIHGRAELSVWAPLASQVKLFLPERDEYIPLQRHSQGYWKLPSASLSAGTSYLFQLNDRQLFPDPASRSQPEGVHGPSEALNLAEFPWNDQNWKNPPLAEYFLYEVHTGTFPPQGTFQALEEKLDHLLELGVNAIELMPLAQFPGNRNWGYDGVYPFAVQNSYGGARALQQLVDHCHRKGLAVVLDVVYNHLGPEGNYLPKFGPYFTEKYRTPWGTAINFDDAWCDGVRSYFIENALMWFRDFHVDALRLDAVHAIRDFGPVHFLQGLREQVSLLENSLDKPLYLIAECDLNDTRYLHSLQEDGYGMDAQWLDEFHHALRVAAGQEPLGYYADFDGIGQLAKSYRDAYVFDGIYSPHRRRKFGTRADRIPGERFVVFSQNHDQVGNRMLGERTSRLLNVEMQKLLAGAIFCAPYLPMLFMGEEWGEPNPFLYFVSHSDPDLVEAVRQGRKAEFEAFHLQGEPPDPQAEETFLQSRLQWDLPVSEPHNTLFHYYRALIRFRKEDPVLSRPDRAGLETFVLEPQQVLMVRRDDRRIPADEPAWQVLCLMNFSGAQQDVRLPFSHPGEFGQARRWHKAFDSTSPPWKELSPTPESIHDGEMIRLEPASFTVYRRALT